MFLDQRHFDVADLNLNINVLSISRHVNTMKGQVLDSISEETDVGVRMADTLKPGEQCRKAAKTAQTVLSQMLAVHYRDRHTFMHLYKQYVRPH